MHSQSIEYYSNLSIKIQQTSMVLLELVRNFLLGNMLFWSLNCLEKIFTSIWKVINLLALLRINLGTFHAKCLHLFPT
jgi:hypothetical protein